MSSDETLRILRITSSLYPEKLGGIGLHAHTMSKLQAEAGHDVTVLTSDYGDRSKPRNEVRAGYQILRYREVGRPLGNTITPGVLEGLLSRRNTYDIVHIHSHLFFTSNVAAAIEKLGLFDAPVVVTNHGAAVETGPRLITDVYFPTLGKFTFNVADVVFCYTETDKELLQDAGVTAPIRVVHNGIDVETFRPLEDVATDPNQILYVGMLKRKKGIHHLLRAFDRLQDDYPELELKIVGDGPYEAELKELRASEGVENVTFTGRIDNGDLPAVYNEGAVSVLPSESEGLPRVVMEAMACGNPVVTSDLPQLEDFVEGAGRQVPYGDVEGLRDALEAIVTNPDAQAEMGATGRERIVESYSWEETVQQTTDTYHALVE
ncbi:glycosyltransferase family 4 protein [Natronococcus roseus]|uniref:glycosyltransferase family 4 protein n=1 Tax=Natronococcus roseus TaxID=1052014 RepID=UPI00374CFFC5